MKKYQSYCVLLIALLFGGTIEAKVDNYVGLYADAGEWSFLPSGSDYKASYGVTGGLGFLYEMQAGDDYLVSQALRLQAGKKYGPTRFLLDVGLGAQAGMTAFMQNSNSEIVLPDQQDLDKKTMTFDYVYEIKDRHDNYKDVCVQVPLMVGVQHRKFYMLVGVKANAHMLTRAHTSAKIDTYGRYKEFDDFRNMPEYQFFTDYALKGVSNAKLKLHADLSLEVGGRLGLVTDAVGFDVPKRTVEYRLAGFVDYGIMDLHTNGTNEALGVPSDPDNPSSMTVTLDKALQYNGSKADYPTYNTYPVYNSTSMMDPLVFNDIMSTKGFADKVTNLVVGIKFTILFQIPEPGQCAICRDAYGISPSPRSGRLQYEE